MPNYFQDSEKVCFVKRANERHDSSLMLFFFFFFLNTAIKNSDEVMCLSVRRNATTVKRSRLLSSG